MRRTQRLPSSGKCQITHWRQVHKEECQQLETYNFSTSLKAATIEETVHERVLVEDSMGSQFYGFGMKQTVLENASSNIINPSFSTGELATNAYSNIDTSQITTMEILGINRVEDWRDIYRHIIFGGEST